MTQTPHKSTPRWADLSDDVLESLETGRTTAIEAMRRFIDQVTPVIADQSRRKAIIDAALNLAEELNIARIEFLRRYPQCRADAEQGVRPPLMSRSRRP